jgi:transcriptional regulator with XRE-family HTH domain
MYPNLKLQLFKIGMRQNQLAQSLGIDESMLSKIVNGFREPSQEIREQIASLLDSDSDWLFHHTDSITPAAGAGQTLSPLPPGRSSENL